MLEGAIEPKAIAKHAKKLGFPAIAITDRNGLYGVMPFEDGAREQGVQPIIGMLLGIARPDSEQQGGFVADWLALYAQDEGGYTNLCRLASMSHLDRPDGQDANVTFEQLQGMTDGVIALTAASEGGLTRLLAEGQNDAAARYLDTLKALFPDRLYIELSRRRDLVEEAAEDALIALAYAQNLPLVATNAAFFAEPDFYDAHDALLCIAGRRIWPKRYLHWRTGYYWQKRLGENF